MSVEEYLHTQFEDSDQEYLDGEVAQHGRAAARNSASAVGAQAARSRRDEYRVEWVWVIDPDERRALCYSPTEPGGMLVEDLRTTNPSIAISLGDLLSALG